MTYKRWWFVAAVALLGWLSGWALSSFGEPEGLGTFGAALWGVSFVVFFAALWRSQWLRAHRPEDTDR
jgi:hypothetical protein